jgi:TRAP-type mannitol/chloroaromatic compound transport system permease large subunit
VIAEGVMFLGAAVAVVALACGAAGAFLAAVCADAEKERNIAPTTAKRDNFKVFIEIII